MEGTGNGSAVGARSGLRVAQRKPQLAIDARNLDAYLHRSRAKNTTPSALYSV
jgi:hypothetical protein